MIEHAYNEYEIFKKYMRFNCDSLPGDFYYNIKSKSDYQLLKENIHIIYGLSKMKYPNILVLSCEEINQSIIYYCI